MEEKKLLNVSSNPHVRDAMTTQKIMLNVIIALLPATIFGCINFGWYALVLVIVTTGAAVLTEYIYCRLMKKPNPVWDLSAAVTGLLLALNLPPTLPVWIAILGAIFAIIVVKQLFGGLGQNFMNPALAARCFLMISFAGKMTTFTYDAVSTATPLASLEAGESVNVLSMFLGNTAGTIGETSAICLLAGGIYLIVRKIIDWRIPVFYILTVAVYMMIYSRATGGGFDLVYVAAQLCGGGLMLGSFFMATDYVTSPITKWGRVIFAVFIGALTATFRLFGGSAEGVSYAIIIGNSLVPLIERITVPKSFGKGAQAK